MHQARQWLVQDRLVIVVIAKRLGYDSEASFSRAFKRVLGFAPSHFRTKPENGPDVSEGLLARTSGSRADKDRWRRSPLEVRPPVTEQRRLSALAYWPPCLRVRRCIAARATYVQQVAERVIAWR
jgi:AraC-like DNA-binding protein